MNRLTRVLAPTVLMLALGTAGATAAQAQQVCETYSQGCDGGGDPITDEPTQDTGTVVDQPGRSLPITGGELTLLSTAGLGALAGGSVLLVAGRRRRTA